MSTMLRSLKFVRKLSTTGRRLGLPIQRFAPEIPLHPRCLAPSTIDRNYVTNVGLKEQYKGAANVDMMIREIDRKINFTGFIYKEDIENVLKAIVRKGLVSSTQALLLIRCCGNFLSTESFKTRQFILNEIWETIKELNVQLDISHYNALLLVYIENDVDFSPLNILLEMKDKKIEPNRVTFQRLIEQYCNKGDIAGTTKILEHMSQQDIAINENIFCSLIKGHSVAGDLDSALNIVNIMKQANIQPSTRTYSTLLCAHARKGDIEAVKNTLTQANENNILISDKDILEVIYTLSINEYSSLLDEMINILNKGSMYNRDAIATMYRLIEKKKIDDAYKLLKTLRVSEKVEIVEKGSFFIKKLVINDLDPEIIAKYCTLLKEEKLNSASFDTAVYTAFLNNKPNLALSLFKSWKDSGDEIREHYFYPIFASYGRANNLQGVLDSLSSMIVDFNVTPLIKTVQNFVIPQLIGNPMNSVDTLTQYNLSFIIGANAMINYLLQKGKTVKAAEFINSTHMKFKQKLLIKSLTYAFVQTNDLRSFIDIVHHQYVFTGKEEINNQNVPEDLHTPKQFIDLLLTEVLEKLPQSNTSIVVNILNELLSKGLSIEPETSNKVKSYLGQACNSEIEDVLSKLISQESQPAQLNISNSNVQSRGYPSYKDLNVLQQKAETSDQFKMTLIQQYAKLRNSAAVDELLQKLDETNPTYSNGFCATMISHYSKSNNIEKADYWFKKMLEIEPNSKLDKSKILNYAEALIKNNRADDALKILTFSTIDSSSARTVLCEKLITSVSNYCPDLYEEFIKVLQEQQYVEKMYPNIVAPIIKKYLENNEFDKVIKIFKWACETYNIVPMKNVIMMHLIKNEDTKSLQEITDLCVKVHGELNALFDLAIAFLDCNLINQARKVMETPGFFLKRDKVMYVVRMCNELNQTTKLENLIQLLSGLYTDIEPVYLQLLQAYEKNGEWKKCLSLWTQMQDENIIPSQTFMTQLERILKKYDQTIPFAETKNAIPENDKNLEIHQAISSGNYNKAEILIQDLKRYKRSNYYKELLYIHIQQGKLKEAVAIVHEILNVNNSSNILIKKCESEIRNVFKHLVETDNFSEILQIVKNYNLRKIKLHNLVSFNKYINKIYYESGKYSDFLTHLENVAKNPEQTIAANSMIYTSIAVKAMQDNPALVEKIRKIADIYMKQYVFAPISVLWVYEFLRNSPEADEIWNNSFKNTKKFHSISVIKTLDYFDSLDRVPQVTEKLLETKFNSEEKQTIFTKLLEIVLNSSNPKKYEIAYECLRYISKETPIEKLSNNIITEIEQNLTDGKTLKSLQNTN